jgi:hypothetical protein
MRDVKIQQVTELETAEPQITQELRAMYGQDRLDCLELDDNSISNKKIDAVTVIDGQLFISNGN